jgi:S-(hydroxymethyl)glutathione dehydrogenase / alcohol dehydrogenase
LIQSTKFDTTNFYFFKDSDLSASTGKIVGSNFPVILGHEGAGIVESVGEDVTTFKVGDHVIPLFLPQCKQCIVCQHETANFCLQFGGNQMKGLMPDGTSRLTCRGQKIFTFVGCSTFSEFSVLSVANLSKINPMAPLEKVCLLSCGVSTGYGAALNTAKVKPGSSCAVWGLGALGLAALLGCKISGAKRIFAIDINSDKFKFAKELGATDCINPKDIEIPIQEHLRKLTGGLGVDYTFEAIGSAQVMKQAFESAAIGYGVCILIGVAPSGESPPPPNHLLTHNQNSSKQVKK